jgi:iron-sulfur cluster insertion protein
MIELTQNAVNHLEKFSRENAKDTKGKHFRIYVEGGGCSGFQYGYTFDEAKEDDEKIPFGKNQTLLIDLMSINFLEGSTLDYVDDFRGAGFMVKNPNASATCSCGQSFSA